MSILPNISIKTKYINPATKGGGGARITVSRGGQEQYETNQRESYGLDHLVIFKHLDLFCATHKISVNFLQNCFSLFSKRSQRISVNPPPRNRKTGESKVWGERFGQVGALDLLVVYIF